MLQLSHNSITACGVTDAIWRARSRSSQEAPVITAEQKAKIALDIDVTYMLHCYDAGREEIFHYLWSQFGEKILEQEKNSSPYDSVYSVKDSIKKRTLTDARILQLMLPVLHREKKLTILINALQNQYAEHVFILLRDEPKLLQAAQQDLGEKVLDIPDIKTWNATSFSLILKSLVAAGFNLNKISDNLTQSSNKSLLLSLCSWMKDPFVHIDNYNVPSSTQYLPKIFTEMVRLIIEHGADVTKADGNGFTPLMILGYTPHKSPEGQVHCYYYNWDIALIVKLLLAAGANVEQDRKLLASHDHVFTQQFEKIFSAYAEEQAAQDATEAGVETRAAKKLRTIETADKQSTQA